MAGRVAITGIGCVSSLGCPAPVFAGALASGEHGFVPYLDSAGFPLRTSRAARVRGFDPASVIAPLKLRRVDDVGRITIGAAIEALERAGFPKRAEGYDDVGIALGSFTAGVHASAEYLTAYQQQGAAAAPAILFANTVGNAPASVCGLELGLRGPNATVTHKEASGLAAVELGAQLVRRRKAAVMLAGGADVLETSFYRVHDWFRVLAPGHEACRPFDAQRCGFLLGEGAFLFALEDEGSAASRGATILGTLLGTASAGAPSAVNAWPTRTDALTRVMRDALDRAGVTPDAIDVVYAAANGSHVLDRTEALAIRDVFGDRAVPVCAVKGALGESGAAGAAALAAALLMAGRGVVPPTVGFRTPAPETPPGVSGSAQPLGGPLALIHSVGSGGTCVAVVVRAGA
ncbi:MAG TPA: beta-ketoacyl synthase N-terminal-like domain-containing protein [Vicinamibacterales bacterium]